MMLSKLFKNISKKYNISENNIEHFVICVITKLCELIYINNLEDNMDSQLLDMLYQDAVKLVAEEKEFVYKIINSDSIGIKKTIINTTYKLIKNN